MQQKPKPIRRTAFGITSRTNVPYDQPLTPGLRKQVNVSAIGFTHDLGLAEQSEWMKAKTKRD